MSLAAGECLCSEENTNPRAELKLNTTMPMRLHHDSQNMHNGCECIFAIWFPNNSEIMVQQFGRQMKLYLKHCSWFSLRISVALGVVVIVWIRLTPFASTPGSDRLQHAMGHAAKQRPLNLFPISRITVAEYGSINPLLAGMTSCFTRLLVGMRQAAADFLQGTSTAFARQCHVGHTGSIGFSTMANCISAVKSPFCQVVWVRGSSKQSVDFRASRLAKQQQH